VNGLARTSTHPGNVASEKRLVSAAGSVMSYSASIPRSGERPGVRLPPGIRPIDLAPTPGPARAYPIQVAQPRRLSPDVALSGLYEISKIVTSPQRLEIILANTVSVLSAFMCMRHGMIVILDAAGDPDIVATGGGYIPAGASPRARVPQKAIDQIAATQTALVVHDTAASPLFADLPLDRDEAGKVSYVGVPIRIDGKVVGTLSIDRPRDGAIEFRLDEDIRFLTMVANLLAQVVKMHRLVAADRATLMRDNELSRGRVEGPASALGPGAKRIVGDSEPMRALMRTISILAPTSTTVLLRGESGTGKELIAGAIHESSKRADKPYVKVNCAALSETVLESELFGHEKGAFTNAVATKPGRFELADGGTLFLDEIGEISANFQAKLLRVLQEGEFERVGGTRTIKVDVRLICATNRDLEAMVAAGTFRADLYYRVSVLPVMVPALRERPGDIGRIASTLVNRFNRENGTKLAISRDAADILSRCYFPGNVRELENCVRRAATLARGDALAASDLACVGNRCLSSTLWKGTSRPNTNYPVPQAAAHAPPAIAIPPFAEAKPMNGHVNGQLNGHANGHVNGHANGHANGAQAECGCADADARAACKSADNCASHGAGERERLIEAMEKTGWVQAKAARLLDITPRQIGYALRKHAIEIKRY
jgi:Nif-specific regulatory protein